MRATQKHANTGHAQAKEPDVTIEQGAKGLETNKDKPQQTGALRPKNGEMRQMEEAGLRDADVGPTRGDVREGNA